MVIDVAIPTTYVNGVKFVRNGKTLESGRPVPTPGTLTRSNIVPQALNYADHKAYRDIVGKCCGLQ